MGTGGRVGNIAILDATRDQPSWRPNELQVSANEIAGVPLLSRKVFNAFSVAPD